MNIGKTLFAQIVDFFPWTSFARIVDRYGGDARSSSFACTAHFRVMIPTNHRAWIPTSQAKSMPLIPAR